MFRVAQETKLVIFILTFLCVPKQKIKKIIIIFPPLLKSSTAFSMPLLFSQEAEQASYVRKLLLLPPHPVYTNSLHSLEKRSKYLHREGNGIEIC